MLYISACNESSTSVEQTELNSLRTSRHQPDDYPFVYYCIVATKQNHCVSPSPQTRLIWDHQHSTRKGFRNFTTAAPSQLPRLLILNQSRAKPTPLSPSPPNPTDNLYHSAMVQLMSLWLPRLGMSPTPLPLLIVAIRVALVTVAFVESTLLVEYAAPCGHERRGEEGGCTQ